MYTLAFAPAFICNDSPERLDFHIQSGDYFSFLATKLGFLEEAVKKCVSMSPEEQKIANELRHDLRYVQAHYKILPRSGAEIQDMRPSGDLFSK
jgi:hypothetical protein